MGSGWGGPRGRAGEASSRLPAKKNITFPSYHEFTSPFPFQKFLTNLGWGVYMRWNLFFRSYGCGDL